MNNKLLFESWSNASYALVARAMNLKQRAIDRALWCFYFDAMIFM